MINLSFFPSRSLAFYLVRLFMTRTFAVLVALVLILMTLDLLGESGKILAVPGNTDADLWRYVGLRLPILFAHFLPFSVLLGTLIAFVGLNQHSEVVAMKAAGLSAHQILAPLIIASIGIAGALFVFNETVVVDSARVVNAWSDNDYKPIPPDRGILSNVWVLNGDDLIVLDYWTLKRRIAELEAAGRPADEARAGLAHKVSGPVSTLLMPLLAAVAAFGLARSGQVLLRASLGMALGFAYFVADNFSLAMGNAGAYPPLVAAWGPFLLFLLIGETVLVRTEE